MDKIKILVVEDEVLIAEDLRYCLVGLGYEVLKPVESGELALEVIKSESVQLVLMDILLKGKINGIEAARMIKEKYNIPFIYMTSHSDQVTLEAAKETEPLGYILKPFSENELHGTIELALHKHQMNLKYQESLNQFKYIYENAPLGIYRTTPDGKVLMANPKLLDMFGFNSLEDFQKINLDQYEFHPQYPRDLIKEKIEKEGKLIGWEAVWNRPDGKLIHVRENAIGIRDDQGKIIYYEGTVEDITDKKILNEKIEESEERYRDLVEKACLGIIIYDIEGNIIYSNRQAPELFGYSFEEAKHLNVNDWIHPDDVEMVHDYHRKRMNSERVPAQYEFRGIKQNGEIIYLEVKDGLYKKKNKILGIRTYLWDVTKRKQAEARVEESEARFRMLYEGMPAGYQSLDDDGKIVEVNQKWCKILGYAKKDVLGQHFKNFIPSTCYEKFDRIFNELKEKGQVENTHLELIPKKKTKIPIVVVINGSVTYDINHKVIECHCIFMETTERYSDVIDD